MSYAVSRAAILATLALLSCATKESSVAKKSTIDDDGKRDAPMSGNVDRRGDATVDPVTPEAGSSSPCCDADVVDRSAETVGAEPNEYGVAWRDAFMFAPCTRLYEGGQCLAINQDQICPGAQPNFEDSGYRAQQVFEIGGTLGATYTVRLLVNGIVGGKYYQNGSRDNGEDYSNPDRPEGTDTFYRGGEPVPSNFGVYKITVRNPDGAKRAHYYLNSFPEDSGFEARRTFPIAFEKEIDVRGGGTVEYLVQVSGCRSYDNCGPGVHGGDVCPEPRNIPNEPGLMLPESYLGQSLSELNVRTGALQPFSAQAIHIRVTEVRAL